MNQSAGIRAAIFKKLHEREGVFVIPNPWDAGSAKLLASIGFEALATTSAGLAFSLGKPDGEGVVMREETLRNAQDIIAATNLPVAADLENGYGDAPEDCAKTILLAADAGLAGGSDLSFRIGGRADKGSGKSRAEPSRPFYIDGQGGEPDLWPSRSCGHHPSPGSLCRCGCRCALCTRIKDTGRGRCRRQGCGATAGECSAGDESGPFFIGRSGRTGREKG